VITSLLSDLNLIRMRGPLSGIAATSVERLPRSS
jgi:hypothetical protein